MVPARARMNETNTTKNKTKRHLNIKHKLGYYPLLPVSKRILSPKSQYLIKVDKHCHTCPTPFPSTMSVTGETKLHIRSIKIVGANRTRTRTIEAPLESIYEASTVDEVTHCLVVRAIEYCSELVHCSWFCG